MECMIVLASSNGRPLLLRGLVPQLLCKLHIQPLSSRAFSRSDCPPSTVQVTGSEAAKLSKHSASEQHLLPWVQKVKEKNILELLPFLFPHLLFSWLSPCSSWNTRLFHSGKQSPFPSSICPGHKGIRSRSLTVSGSGKRRPAQSLGGNYLLIASVSQKHHSNLSWDSRFFSSK